MGDLIHKELQELRAAVVDQTAWRDRMTSEMGGLATTMASLQQTLASLARHQGGGPLGDDYAPLSTASKGAAPSLTAEERAKKREKAKLRLAKKAWAQMDAQQKQATPPPLPPGAAAPEGSPPDGNEASFQA